MHQHFADNLLEFGREEGLEGEVVVRIGGGRVELDDVLLGVAGSQELRRPVHDEDGLEKGVGRLGDSRRVAPHEVLHAELDYARQLARSQQHARVVQEETLVHPHEVVQQVTEPTDVLNALHVSECNLAEVGVDAAQVVVVGGVFGVYGDRHLHQVDVGTDRVFLKGSQHHSEEFLEELGEGVLESTHYDFENADHAFDL